MVTRHLLPGTHLTAERACQPVSVSLFSISIANDHDTAVDSLLHRYLICKGIRFILPTFHGELSRAANDLVAKSSDPKIAVDGRNDNGSISRLHSWYGGK